jgi:DNA-3-methyladenine glycosylase II
VARVPVRAPFRLDLTATVLRRLSSNVVDVFDGTTYRRLLGEPHAPTLLSVTQRSPSEIEVRVEGPGASQIDPHAAARRTLGVDVELDAFYTGARTVRWLDELATGARGVKPPRYPTLWESVVNAVVFQQVSIHAAAAILRRVIERYAPPHVIADVRLAPFPAPQTLRDADPQELRALGLSINKINALVAVARAIDERRLVEEPLDALPTPELMTALVAHKGIGPWTAAVIALRGFGRLDVFPMNDSGVAASLRTLSSDPVLDAAPIIAALAPQQGMLYYHLLIARLVARGELTLP